MILAREIKKMSLSPYQILRKPVITEKAAIVGSYNNSVVFEVNPKATKTEIKRAVEKKGH